MNLPQHLNIYARLTSHRNLPTVSLTCSLGERWEGEGEGGRRAEDNVKSNEQPFIEQLNSRSIRLHGVSWCSWRGSRDKGPRTSIISTLWTCTPYAGWPTRILLTPGNSTPHKGQARIPIKAHNNKTLEGRGEGEQSGQLKVNSDDIQPWGGGFS